MYSKTYKERQHSTFVQRHQVRIITLIRRKWSPSCLFLLFRLSPEPAFKCCSLKPTFCLWSRDLKKSSWCCGTEAGRGSFSVDHHQLDLLPCNWITARDDTKRNFLYRNDRTGERHYCIDVIMIIFDQKPRR
jgi:hypothetical protein